MTSTNDLPWTEEKETLLRELWKQGISGSKIAAELGCRSSGSVAGKARRLGLPKRKEGSHGSYVPTPSAKPNAKATPPRSNFNPPFKKPGAVPGRRPDTVFGQFNKIQPWKPPSLTPEQKRIVLDGERSTGVPLTDTVMEIVGHGKQASIRWSGGLQPGQCKWVVNAQERGGEYLFCGAKALNGCVYCAEHERRAVA